MRLSLLLCLNLIAFAPAVMADGKMRLENLPEAVRTSVQEKTKDRTLIGVSQEKEKGKTIYELETKGHNGKTLDYLLDSTGGVIETEEEVSLDSIPAPAKDAIEKRLAGGSVQKVEKLTRGPKISYEAAIRTKTGKRMEIGVNADGSAHKG